MEQMANPVFSHKVEDSYFPAMPVSTGTAASTSAQTTTDMDAFAWDDCYTLV